MNPLLLRALAFFAVGLYLFSQDTMHQMLLGLGLMLYGGIGWAIDSLAIYISEAVEGDLNKRLDRLETRLQELTDSK
jgi:multisubunit Na+/H+ antiporter MnhC subunit